METAIEQCAAIRFCWKAGFNATKMFEMIRKVYGESFEFLNFHFRYFWATLYFKTAAPFLR